jgi:hypothetical protein
MKKILATVTAGVVLSGLAGVALTAGFATPASASIPSAVSSPTATSHHPMLMWLRDHRRAVARDVAQVSAKAIGVTAKDLVSALHSGQSIAQVAKAHNVDPQTVVTALVQAGDVRIGQAVNNHKLTQAQAAKVEAAIPGAVTKLVNHVFAQHARGATSRHL